jgi:predicted phage terminase large subunit-like protein
MAGRLQAELSPELFSTLATGFAAGEDAAAEALENLPEDQQMEAMSALIRERHKDWYRSTFGTREEPGAAIVVVQTRWNADDLSGWLLTQELGEDDLPERWHIVCMPAIKEYKQTDFPATCTVEPDERLPGEALCPERYDLPKLGKLKRRVGTRYWNALYQQSPAPDEGHIFKRQHWRYWQPRGVTLPAVTVRLADGSVIEIAPVELPATFDQMLQSWDLAFKDTKGSDFVAGQVWARAAADKFLLDYCKDRLGIVASMERIAHFRLKWPRATGILVEDKANGPAVIEMLQGKIEGLIAVEPEGGKVSRAYAAQPEVEAGNVYLPHPALFPWVSEFIDSCAGFPNAANDDDVDAFTQVLTRMRQGADEVAAVVSQVVSRDVVKRLFG